jgi:transglutaminase-like putative cysteine protease/tetratricopeptide (TPR) repeat protein
MIVRRFAAVLGLLFAASPAAAAPTSLWDREPFTATSEELRAAADEGVRIAADAPAVVLLEEVRYRFDAEGRRDYLVHRVYQVLTAEGLATRGSLDAVWFPWYQEAPEVRARVLAPDGQFHELDPRTIEVGAVEADEHVYRDARATRAPLPALTPGAIVETTLRTRDTRPAFAAGWTWRWPLADLVPVRRVRAIVEAPAELPLHLVVRGAPGVAPRRSRAGKLQRWVVERAAVAALELPELAMPSDTPWLPTLGITTARSWQAVAAAYAKVIDEQIGAGELALKVPAPTAGADRAQTLAAALAQLHASVRYTGLEFGSASIVPWTPAETLRRQYGDCKDQATLLVALLRAANIPAHVALLRVGPVPDVDPELPGLTFDHAIVYVPGTPAVWIDPTDELARAGELPASDQDRLALVVDAKTTRLVRTPASRPEDNRLVVQRDVFLAEIGAARVVDSSESHGETERSARRYYRAAKPDEVARMLSAVLRNEHGDAKLDHYQSTDPADLSQPFRVTVEASGSQGAFTESELATVTVHDASLVVDLPDLLRRKPGTADRSRRHDLELTAPWVVDWRYRIVLPPGFAPRDLPAPRTIPLGPMVVTREYHAAAGEVHARFVFDTRKRRFTPAEVKSIQAAIQGFYQEPAVKLVFDHVGLAHVGAGRIQEGLAEIRKLVALHPGEALHHAQLARAYLTAGMGEAARAEAQAAVKLEPRSAVAQSELGWMFLHDGFGRWFGKGSDRDAAIRAYRTAKDLDPEQPGIRADLALIYEHDAQGTRYARGARVADAIAEYQALRRDLDEHRFDESLLWCLVRAERFAEALELARSLPTSRSIDGQRVAAAAAIRTEDGIKEAAALGADARRRGDALEDAAYTLGALRRYQAAGALFVEAGRVSGNGDLISRGTLLGRVRGYETAAPPPDDPRRPMYDLIVALVRRELTLQATESLLARRARELPSRTPAQAATAPESDLLVAQKATAALSRWAQKLGWPNEVILDVLFGLATMTVDGVPSVGWRIVLETPEVPGTQRLVGYAVREDGKPRLLALGPAREPLGAEALALVANNDLAGARRWLGWAYEGQSSKLWPPGPDAAEDEALRHAAAALMVDGPRARAALPILQSCADAGKPNAEACAEGLARAHRTLGQHRDAQRVADGLLAAQPDDERLKALHIRFMIAGGDPAAAEAAARAWLNAHAATAEIRGVLGEALAAQGRFSEASQLAREILDAGPQTARAANVAAWWRLLSGSNDDVALELAQRAVRLSSRGSDAILNTEAAVLAARGDLRQAYVTLEESMAVGGADDPRPQDWLVWGRIAAACGLPDAAHAAYRKVIAASAGQNRPDSAAVLAARWDRELSVRAPAR